MFFNHLTSLFSYIYKKLLQKIKKWVRDTVNNLQKKMGKKTKKQAYQNNDKGSNVHQNAQILLSDQRVDQNNQTKTRNVGRWTNLEHQIFLKYYRKTNMDWKAIAPHIPGRTAQQVRSHAQKFQARQAKRLQKLMDRNLGKHREEQYGNVIGTRFKDGIRRQKRSEPVKTKISQKSRNKEINQPIRKTHKKIKPIEQPTDDIQERNIIQGFIPLDNISEEKADIIIPVVYKLGQDMSQIEIKRQIISNRDYEVFLNKYGQEILKHTKQIYYPVVENKTHTKMESEQQDKLLVKSFTLVNDSQLNRTAYSYFLRQNQMMEEIGEIDSMMDEQKGEIIGMNF